MDRSLRRAIIHCKNEQRDLHDPSEFSRRSPSFVRPKRGARELVRQLREKTSIKDAIEACGVPHPEIDLILVDGASVDFSHQLTREARIEVYPVPAPLAAFPGAHLQRHHWERFVADGHLGKLTRDLRLLGIDVAYSPLATDAELVAVSVNEKRALLTRDRPLLMHAAVRDGYYPRSQKAEEQTREVARRFELKQRIVPFTRCLSCNGMLATIPKSEVINQLRAADENLLPEFSPLCAVRPGLLGRFAF